MEVCDKIRHCECDGLEHNPEHTPTEHLAKGQLGVDFLSAVGHLQSN